MWRETRQCFRTVVILCISIHSLRVEGDFIFDWLAHVILISIHSLRVEGDLRGKRLKSGSTRFQSTPSVWRETIDFVFSWPGKRFQSTPSVWRETNILQLATTHIVFQSTPSVWRETVLAAHNLESSGFQSTPSVWRETFNSKGISLFDI